MIVGDYHYAHSDMQGRIPRVLSRWGISRENTDGFLALGRHYPSEYHV